VASSAIFTILRTEVPDPVLLIAVAGGVRREPELFVFRARF